MPLPLPPTTSPAALAALFSAYAASHAKDGWRFWGDGASWKPYDLNLIGIRSPDRMADTFDDTLVVLYRDPSGAWVAELQRVTTTPGLSALQDPMRSTGTAIICPGYYRSCWVIGKHKGQYEALVQAKPGVFRAWRDPNADGRLDMSGKVYTDAAGINCHRSGEPESKLVGGWSAGCQVNAVAADHERKMLLCREQVKRTGVSTFSYGLIDCTDAPEFAFLLPPKVRV